MMLSNLFRIFQGQGYEAIVDLGTEMVKAIGFKKGRGKVSYIQYAKEYYTSGDVDAKGFKEVLDAGVIIEKTIQRACNGAFPVSCEVILGPLFVIPCIAHKNFVRQFPENPISEEEKNGMVSELEKLCLDFYSLKHHAAHEGEKPVFLEHIFQTWSIDGYEEQNIVGQKGTEIAGTSLRMYTSSSKIRTLEKLLKKVPEKSLRFSYEFSYFFDCIQSLSPGHRTALLIDVGGRVTSLFLVEEGRVKEIRSYVFGSHDVTDHVARSWSIGFFEAEKLKKEYEAGSLTSEAQMKAAEIIAPLWNEFFERIFSEVSSLYENQSPHLISDIFLIGGGVSSDSITICKDALLKQKGFVTLGDFKVEIVTPASFLNFSSFPGLQNFFTGPQDNMCALALKKRVKTAEKRRI